jgi:hypothetical protein
MKTFRSADGTTWGVKVQSPGASNAMVVFMHPDGTSSRRDRYAWYLWHGPEARSVTGRLSPKEVLERLTDRDVALLFRRSSSIDSGTVGRQSAF